MTTIKKSLIEAVKRKNSGYLKGVLQVERVYGKGSKPSLKKIEWLETQIEEIRNDP